VNRLLTLKWLSQAEQRTKQHAVQPKLAALPLIRAR
jgi:hypothetical protein